MYSIAKYLVTTLLALALVGCASYPLAKMSGGVLVDSAGMTLYTFDKDTPNSGKSSCNGPCAALWPPVPATGNVSGDYSVVTRDDGSKQLAYKGKPVYRYTPDQKAGDKLGDNFKDVWHVIK